jgi:ketosteroid isomerase-like protein
MVTHEDVTRQEATFAGAFAAGDLSLARALYDPAVVYVSPTVRLFGWPRTIVGVDRTLEFITLTVARCTDVAYEAVDSAVVSGGDAAFVCVHFDWSAAGRRLRSRYAVLYRYGAGRIVRQEVYYDPSAAPDLIPARSSEPSPART